MYDLQIVSSVLWIALTLLQLIIQAFSWKVQAFTRLEFQNSCMRQSCQCNCSGRDTDSWSFLFCHLPRILPQKFYKPKYDSHFFGLFPRAATFHHPRDPRNNTHPPQCLACKGKYAFCILLYIAISYEFWLWVWFVRSSDSIPKDWVSLLYTRRGMSLHSFIYLTDIDWTPLRPDSV